MLYGVKRNSLFQKIWKLLCNVRPEMFSFRETCHRQMAHALIVGSKHGLETCVPRVVVCIQLIVKKYSIWRTYGWVNPNSRAESRDLLQALVPQLQLRHFHWLMPVHSAGDPHPQMSGVALPVSLRRCCRRRNTLASG